MKVESPYVEIKNIPTHSYVPSTAWTSNRRFSPELNFNKIITLRAIDTLATFLEWINHSIHKGG